MQVKGKRSVSTTPKKNLANILSEEAPIVVPNLRLEAKLTAEVSQCSSFSCA